MELENIVAEIDNRYYQLFESKSISINEHNKNSKKTMSHIVIIIDEFMDMLLYAKDEFRKCVEAIIERARVVGIHIIMSTERSDQIKQLYELMYCFPTRLSFKARRAAESVAILDEEGAETLLPYCDALFSDAGRMPVRIHTPYIDMDDLH